jgi:hypothetical protein
LPFPSPTNSELRCCEAQNCRYVHVILHRLWNSRLIIPCRTVCHWSCPQAVLLYIQAPCLF